jgi:exopolysaccharide biosynthesis polyprenyl glycosylphosphotransferase
MNSGKSMTKPLRWKLTSNEQRLILLIGDLLVGVISLVIALYFWAGRDTWLNFSWKFLLERPAPWFYFMPLIWMVLLVETYDVRSASHRKETLQGIGIAALVSFILYLFLYFTADPNSLPRLSVAVFIVVITLLTLAWRLLYISIFTAPLMMRRVLIVGAGRAGSTLAKVIKERWPPPFYLVGLIDDDTTKQGMTIEGYPILGNGSQLLEIVEKENISDLILSISGEMNPELFQALLFAEEQGIEVTTMPSMYEDLLGRVPIFLLQSDWIFRSFVDVAHAGGIYEISKRLIDIAGALVGFIFFIPLLPVVSLAIVLDSGFPIFYQQTRLGKNGSIYKIIKFRTMRQDAEKDGKAQPAAKHDMRVTRVGKLLRKSHIDEFPQFINILRGEMSLVGPRAERPELMEDLQAKVPFYRARLLARPGLTGWAQVNFHYASTIEDFAIKLEYDLYYIKHRNLLLDISILLRTVGTVVGFRGQ